MQFGFAGSPAFAADVLQCVLDAGHKPQFVVTQAAKPTGRGQKFRDTPVSRLAQRERISVVSPRKIDDCTHLIRELELLVVVAYGQILSQSILDAPLHGCINVHPSLLPRWRGASPIEHSILHGDQSTGISIMRIQPALDAGPVFLTEQLVLNGSETTESLSKSLAQLGGVALLRVLKMFEASNVPVPVPQAKSGVSYAPLLTSIDARLDWTQSAQINERKVRAFVGRSPAFTTCGDIRLRILEAKLQKGNFVPGRLYQSSQTVVIGCREDGLRLVTVQLNRGKGTPLNIIALLNGYGRFFKDGIQFD